MTSELIRIKGIFIKITQQDYHKIINGKVKGKEMWIRCTYDIFMIV